MISPKGDIDEFLKHVQESNFYASTICVLARREKAESVGQKHGRYIENLNGLCGLLETHIAPSGLFPYELANMMPLVESLVQRGQLPPNMSAIVAVAVGDH